MKTIQPCTFLKGQYFLSWESPDIGARYTELISARDLGPVLFGDWEDVENEAIGTPRSRN
jgi:hypothetical protein